MPSPLPGVVHFTGHKGAVYALCNAGERDHFLSAAGDGTVVQWALHHPGTGVALAQVHRAIFALHRARNGLLYIGDEDGGLHVVDPVRHVELLLERAHGKGIFSMVQLPDGRIAVAGGDGSLSIWSTAAGGHGGTTLQRRIPLSDDKLRGLALNPDGQFLAVACGDGSIHVLDSTHLNEQFTLAGHGKGANSLAWHPAKPLLVSGGKDGHLRFWRTDAGFGPMHAFPAHKDTIYAIAFNRDGTQLATASRDRTAKLWDAGTFDPLRRLDRHTGGHGYSVNSVWWLNDHTLLTASDDKTVVAWNVQRP